MIQKKDWLDVLSQVITECVSLVKSDESNEAEPWLMIEESIGYENTRLLFEDHDYFPVTNALDLYCHSAQHDRNEVNGISLDDLSDSLIKCVEVLNSGGHDFSSLLPKFKK